MLPLQPAPEWPISSWLNTSNALSLQALRGRPVLAVAFQMLCPGCVSHGLPQAQRARDAFPEAELAVLGLHTVFEHHEAQGSRAALAAFLHEYRLGFPVAIDESDPAGAVPRTMRAYSMQGTPTTLLIDRQGRLRLQRFGHVDDLRLGAAIATLIGEPAADAAAGAYPAPDQEGCDADGCPVPPG